MFCLVITWSDR